MKWFSYLYKKTLFWSSHRHAHYYLAGVSFAESSFFPIPPDVMLLSMGLAKPHHAWRNALIATLFSVLGGLLGYVIGYFAIHFIEPFILHSHYHDTYLKILEWFKEGSTWMVILAGFSPFPYKIFTITAGAMHLPFVPFILGSIIGRGARFYLVSSLMYFFGARIEQRLSHYIDWIGWISLGLFVVIYGLLQLLK